MCIDKELVPIAIGLALIFVGSAYLFLVSPFIAKRQDTAISIVALKVASWLVAGGLLVTVLGILYFMEAIPWWP